MCVNLYHKIYGCVFLTLSARAVTPFLSAVAYQGFTFYVISNSLSLIVLVGHSADDGSAYRGDNA